MPHQPQPHDQNHQQHQHQQQLSSRNSPSIHIIHLSHRTRCNNHLPTPSMPSPPTRQSAHRCPLRPTTLPRRLRSRHARLRLSSRSPPCWRPGPTFCSGLGSRSHAHILAGVSQQLPVSHAPARPLPFPASHRLRAGLVRSHASLGRKPARSLQHQRLPGLQRAARPAALKIDMSSVPSSAYMDASQSSLHLPQVADPTSAGTGHASTPQALQTRFAPLPQFESASFHGQTPRSSIRSISPERHRSTRLPARQPPPVSCPPLAPNPAISIKAPPRARRLRLHSTCRLHVQSTAAGSGRERRWSSRCARQAGASFCSSRRSCIAQLARGVATHRRPLQSELDTLRRLLVPAWQSSSKSRLKSVASFTSSAGTGTASGSDAQASFANRPRSSSGSGVAVRPVSALTRTTSMQSEIASYKHGTGSPLFGLSQSRSVQNLGQMQSPAMSAHLSSPRHPAGPSAMEPWSPVQPQMAQSQSFRAPYSGPGFQTPQMQQFSPTLTSPAQSQYSPQAHFGSHASAMMPFFSPSIETRSISARPAVSPRTDSTWPASTNSGSRRRSPTAHPSALALRQHLTSARVTALPPSSRRRKMSRSVPMAVLA